MKPRITLQWSRWMLGADWNYDWPKSELLVFFGPVSMVWPASPLRDYSCLGGHHWRAHDPYCPSCKRHAFEGMTKTAQLWKATKQIANFLWFNANKARRHPRRAARWLIRRIRAKVFVTR